MMADATSELFGFFKSEDGEAASEYQIDPQKEEEDTSQDFASRVKRDHNGDVVDWDGRCSSCVSLQQELRNAKAQIESLEKFRHLSRFLSPLIKGSRLPADETDSSELPLLPAVVCLFLNNRVARRYRSEVDGFFAHLCLRNIMEREADFGDDGNGSAPAVSVPLSASGESLIAACDNESLSHFGTDQRRLLREYCYILGAAQYMDACGLYKDQKGWRMTGGEAALSEGLSVPGHEQPFAGDAMDMEEDNMGYMPFEQIFLSDDVVLTTAADDGEEELLSITLGNQSLNQLRAGCFNCGSLAHQLVVCPAPLDPQRVYAVQAEIRRRCGSNFDRRRYHADGAVSFDASSGAGNHSKFKPGEMSDSLLKALGCRPNSLPSIIYSMRSTARHYMSSYGQPPGWMFEALDTRDVPNEPSKLSIIDGESGASVTSSAHGDRSNASKQPLVYSLERIPDYVGFNSNAPRSIHDNRRPPIDRNCLKSTLRRVRCFVDAHKVDSDDDFETDDESASDGEPLEALAAKSKSKSSAHPSSDVAYDSDVICERIIPGGGDGDTNASGELSKAAIERLSFAKKHLARDKDKKTKRISHEDQQQTPERKPQTSRKNSAGTPGSGSRIFSSALRDMGVPLPRSPHGSELPFSAMAMNMLDGGTYDMRADLQIVDETGVCSPPSSPTLANASWEGPNLREIPTSPVSEDPPSDDSAEEGQLLSDVSSSQSEDEAGDDGGDDLLPPGVEAGSRDAQLRLACIAKSKTSAQKSSLSLQLNAAQEAPALNHTASDTVILPVERLALMSPDTSSQSSPQLSTGSKRAASPDSDTQQTDSKKKRAGSIDLTETSMDLAETGTDDDDMIDLTASSPAASQSDEGEQSTAHPSPIDDHDEDSIVVRTPPIGGTPSLSVDLPDSVRSLPPLSNFSRGIYPSLPFEMDHLPERSSSAYSSIRGLLAKKKRRKLNKRVLNLQQEVASSTRQSNGGAKH